MAIDPGGRRVQVHQLESGKIGWEPFDHLLIATAAVPIRPDIAGADAQGIYGLSTAKRHGLRRAVDEDNPKQQSSSAAVTSVGNGGSLDLRGLKYPWWKGPRGDLYPRPDMVNWFPMPEKGGSGTVPGGICRALR
jgi:hypothetical protein